MDLKTLRCFLAVAEKLNFSRAAESLYISQPALSLRINSMEDELGVSLFRRSHQYVFLTAAGSALLPEIQELITRIDALSQIAASTVNQLTTEAGKIKVKLELSLPNPMVQLLSKTYRQLYKDFPGIEVINESISFSEYEQELLSRNTDLCFVGLKESERVNPLFNVVVLAREPMVLAYMGKPGLSLKEVLSNRSLLSLKGEERWNYILSNYLASKRIYTKVNTVTGFPAVCACMAQGNSATYMPKTAFESFGNLHFTYITPDIPDSKVLSCIVWAKHNYNPALQLMINYFQKFG